MLWLATLGGLRREGVARIPARGRSPSSSCLNPWSNSFVAAACLGEEKPPCSTYFAQVSPRVGRELGSPMAVEKDDGGLEQVGHGSGAGSTTCQVSRFFQSRETTLTMLRTSSASLFQSPAGRGGAC